MIGGQGPYGTVEMGGMFTLVKVRRDQTPGDYTIPTAKRRAVADVTVRKPGRRPGGGTASTD